MRGFHEYWEILGSSLGGSKMVTRLWGKVGDSVLDANSAFPRAANAELFPVPLGNLIFQIVQENNRLNVVLSCRGLMKPL